MHIYFIEHYKSRNTTVFVTFLDASKAFDRIDHWLLFKKLIVKRCNIIYNKITFILVFSPTNVQ